jgi:hypothetical protein
LAHAIATDAANLVMRKAWPKRDAWGDEDSAVYVETFNRLWPLEADYPDATPEQLAKMRRELGYPAPGTPKNTNGKAPSVKTDS